MQVTAGRSESATPHQLLAAAPVLTALAVDFRRNQWTFSLPAQPVGPGDYVVLRAEDVRKALEVPERPIGDIVLRAPEGGTRVRFYGGHTGDQRIDVESDDGMYEFSAWRDHVPDAAEDRQRYWPGPALWRGHEERTDAAGRKWHTSTQRMVCDDFGTLVSVQS